MDRETLRDWLRLVLTPGIGPGTARRLLAAWGLPGALFQAAPAALRDLVTARQAQALQAEPPQLAALAEATWQWLAQGEGTRRIWSLADPGYPPLLLQTEDPPLMLYGMGACLAQPGAAVWPEGIALVGSRNPTPQGALNAREFARSLSRAGWCVVSGLALGVDGAAHEGALEGAAQAASDFAAPVATIAVVATGLDLVYPRQHAALAQRITERGLILSEYPLGTPPLAENFPRRNRILCGLARGTLVVEAAVRSGSLITARLAAEQGREVFAIPGSIHSPQSRGCHALIRQGAKLVETAQDVLEELPLQAGGPPPIAAPASAPSRAPETGSDPLLHALGFDPASLDTLAARIGLDTGTLLARLLALELEGQVARLPGGFYQRTVAA